MIMCATILEVQRDRLLVRDNSTSQIVAVKIRALPAIFASITG